MFSCRNKKNISTSLLKKITFSGALSALSHCFDHLFVFWQLEFNKAETCKEVCVKKYTFGDKDSIQKLTFLKKSLGLNYHQHWYVYSTWAKPCENMSLDI